MRIAVKSAGGITECFLHADNVAAGIREAARQIAEDYSLPTDLKLWSDPPDASPSRQLAELRSVALDGSDAIVELD